MAQLEAERDELKQKIQATVRSLTGAALDDARDELKRLGDRRNAIEARLAALRAQQTQEMRPVEDVIEEALQVLAEESQRLLTLPIEPLRELVNDLIADATVDMETKAVELKVTLPTWALESKPKQKKRKRSQEAGTADTEAMCPTTNLRSLGASWTQQPLVVAKAECRYVRQKWEACYECRRSAA